MRMIWVLGLAGAACRAVGAYLLPACGGGASNLHEPGLATPLGRHGQEAFLQRSVRAGRRGMPSQPAGQPHRPCLQWPPKRFGIILCLMLLALWLSLSFGLSAYASEDISRALRLRPRHLFGVQAPSTGGQSAADPAKGRGAALHLLWRLLDHLAGLWRRHDAGADAAPRTGGSNNDAGVRSSSLTQPARVRSARKSYQNLRKSPHPPLAAGAAPAAIYFRGSARRQADQARLSACGSRPTTARAFPAACSPGG